jgi:hypothetical protein
MRIARFVFTLSLLTSLAVLPGGAAHAQVKLNGPGYVPDVQQVSGYTLRIVHLERNSYGYEIRRGAEVLVHQRRNPFTGSLQGLATKADAQKTALWVLENVVGTDRMRPRSGRLPDGNGMTRLIPVTVASELGITLGTSR